MMARICFVLISLNDCKILEVFLLILCLVLFSLIEINGNILYGGDIVLKKWATISYNACLKYFNELIRESMS